VNQVPWPIEHIPDADSVFYRVPVGFLRADRKPHPGVFRENKGSMSVDWEKYSTAAECRERPGKPERFAVLKLPAQGIRAISNLRLDHDPAYFPNAKPPLINRAHAGVIGVACQPFVIEVGYEERVRLELFDLAKDWEIAPEFTKS